VCSTILYIADINKKMIDYHGFTVVYQIHFCQINILGGSQSGI
jgi:hypothetical protein